jgi:hypothetical protein
MSPTCTATASRIRLYVDLDHIASESEDFISQKFGCLNRKVMAISRRCGESCGPRVHVAADAITRCRRHHGCDLDVGQAIEHTDLGLPVKTSPGHTMNWLQFEVKPQTWLSCDAERAYPYLRLKRSSAKRLDSSWTWCNTEINNKVQLFSLSRLAKVKILSSGSVSRHRFQFERLDRCINK